MEKTAVKPAVTNSEYEPWSPLRFEKPTLAPIMLFAHAPPPDATTSPLPGKQQEATAREPRVRVS